MALAIQMAERDTCELLCLDLPKAEARRAALPSADLSWIVGRDEKLVSHHVRLGAALAAVYRELQRVPA